MPTLAEVRQQIEAYPDRYIFWTSKEIRALPKILDHGENIRAVTSGMLNGATWLIVCTERRLIFLNCGMFYGMEQVQMPLDRIQSIDHRFSVFFGAISVFDGMNVFTVNMVLKSSIMPFVRVLEEAIYATRHPHVKPAAPAVASQEDVASQLTKLVTLKEKGYLTDAEFEIQKKKILDS